MRERFSAPGFEPRDTTPEDFEHRITSELARRSDVIKAQGGKPEQATVGADFRQSNVRCGTLGVN
jgi:hypothetical protein